MPQNDAASDKPVALAEDVSLEGDDNILVKVNGEAITEYDLNRSLVKKLGPFQASLLKEPARQEALDALVLSKLIAQKAEATLSPTETAQLAKDVDAYREQLLVKHYLATHADVPEPDDAMIQKTYEQNIERFGGGEVKHYDYLTVKQSADGETRTAVLGLLNKANEATDWAQWLAGNRESHGGHLVLASGNTRDTQLHARLDQLIDGMAEGETSNTIIVEGRAYRFRIKKIEEKPAKPIEEVRQQIIKGLQPRLLKDSIQALSEQLRQEASIDYVAKPESE